MAVGEEWGIGAEFIFNADRGIANVNRAHGAVDGLANGLGRLSQSGVNAAGAVARTGGAAREAESSFAALRGQITGIAGGVGSITAAFAPLGLAFGFAGMQASSLAATLEQNMIGFETFLGSAADARRMVNDIRQEAARTPFGENDLIQASKRMLAITWNNVQMNMRLLKIAETMAAIDPSRTVGDAALALNDALSGGGMARMTEFTGFAMKMEQFSGAGAAGSEAYMDAVEAEIQNRITRLTGGRDLVAALSTTFTGRLSTFRDQIGMVLTEAGGRINERLGVALDGAAARFQTVSPIIIRAVDGIADSVTRLSGATVGPMLSRLGAFWDSLGAGQQVQLVQVALGIGAMASALVPLGAFAGVAALALSGLGPIVTGLAGLAGAGGIHVLGAGLALAAAGGWELVEVLGSWIMPAIQQVALAWGEAFSPTGIEGLTTAALAFGHVLGAIAAGAIILIGGLGSVFGVMVDTVITTLEPFLASIFMIGRGIGELLTGTEGGFATLLGGVSGLIASFVSGAIGLVLGAVEMLVRSFGAIVDAIPGARAIVGGTDFGAGTLADVRRNLAADVERTVRGASASMNEQRRQERARPVAVDLGESAIEVNVGETILEADGHEIARTQGKAAVRNGERGTGRPISGPATGRVLRRGTTEIGALGPLEAL